MAPGNRRKDESMTETWNLQLFAEEGEPTPVQETVQEESAPQEEPREETQEAQISRETVQNLRFLRHFQSLEHQGQQLRQQGIPDFDLRKELQNPVFARMTAPGSGVSVADAYYAVHRAELQAAAMEAAVNAVRSGSRRPRESGLEGQAATVTSFDYRRASREQREELKRQIRQAAAEGRKLYPGR